MKRTVVAAAECLGAEWPVGDERGQLSFCLPSGAVVMPGERLTLTFSRGEARGVLGNLPEAWSDAMVRSGSEEKSSRIFWEGRFEAVEVPRNAFRGPALLFRWGAAEGSPAGLRFKSDADLRELRDALNAYYSSGS